MSIAPRAWAAATFGSWGPSGSPVNAVRGPNTSASSRRRRASAALIRSRAVSSLVRLVAPNAVGLVSVRNRW